jgi:hypothetical protein
VLLLLLLLVLKLCRGQTGGLCVQMSKHGQQLRSGLCTAAHDAATLQHGSTAKLLGSTASQKTHQKLRTNDAICCSTQNR